jgi:hypothetical protein
MNNKTFDTGELVWICIWNKSTEKFSKVCGTIINCINNNHYEIFASTFMFIRETKEINIFDKKDDFLSWPLYNEEKNAASILNSQYV